MRETSKKWEDFKYWESINNQNSGGLDSPFNSERLTARSIYLWNQMGTPLPSGSTNGVWGLFPESKALAGFLRYIAFPVFFEIWLVREEWDPHSDHFVAAESLFDLAEKSGKCRYSDDIPRMKNLIKELDTLFASSDEDARTKIHAVAEEFNARWADTSTWTFEIQIFDDPLSAGKEVLRRVAEDITEEELEEELGMSERAWIALCKNVLDDQQAQAKFKEVLAENAWL